VKSNRNLLQMRQQSTALQQDLARLATAQQTYQAKLAERDALGENPREELLRAQAGQDIIKVTLKRRKTLKDQAESVKKRYEQQDEKNQRQLVTKKKSIKDKRTEKEQVPADFDKDEAFGLLRDEGRFTERITRITAAVVLPILPMLPVQLLLTSLLTDIPYMTVATDNVDPEQVAKPRKWSSELIR